MTAYNTCVVRAVRAIEREQLCEVVRLTEAAGGEGGRLYEEGAGVCEAEPPGQRERERAEVLGLPCY